MSEEHTGNKGKSKASGESPHKCPLCGERLVDIGGYWGCFCNLGPAMMAKYRPAKLHDIPGMTVAEHHTLSIGLLATCFDHVPADVQGAIAEALESAKRMGMNIKPEPVTKTRSFPE